MEATYQIEYTDGSDNWFLVDLEIDFDTSMDGIGPYEFWGFKGVDKGHLCIDINEINFDKTNIPAEHLPLIQAVIEKEIDNIEEACKRELRSLQDSKDEHDYDLWKDSQL